MLKEEFRKFHRENPGVVRELIRLLEDAQAAGRRRVGMKMLFEVLRYNRLITTNGDQFKLNNNYTAFYTRLIKRQRPDLGELLVTRRSAADNKEAA